VQKATGNGLNKYRPKLFNIW